MKKINTKYKKRKGMNNLKPMPGNALVEPKIDEGGQREVNGIIVNVVPKSENVGNVIAVGEERGKEPPVKVGQQIIFRPRAGHFVKWNDKKYLLLAFHDILAIQMEIE